jgi:unsaturated rhamnogalacturonyl hydrolase
MAADVRMKGQTMLNGKTIWMALAIGIAALACTAPSRAQSQIREFTDWPAGTSPAEVGKRVAENFVVRMLDFETNPHRQYVIYPEVCAWYGSLTLAKRIN